MRAQISRSRAVSSVALGTPPRTMLERRSSGAGTRLIAPAYSPSTRMMRLSPSFTAGRNFCTTHGSLKVAVNRSKSEPKLRSSRRSRNTASPPLPYKGFITMSPCCGAEAFDLVEVAREQRRRHQLRKLRDEHLLRRIAHLGRVVDHERLGVNALEQVRGRDIGEVEGRVLAHQHHVEGREFLALRRRRV